MKKTKKIFIILFTALLLSVFSSVVVFAEETESFPNLALIIDGEEAAIEEPEVEEVGEEPSEHSETIATGPGILLYAALPILGFSLRRKKNK